MQPHKVAILGGSGYTAVELLKILLRHPHVQVASVTSRQNELVSDLHPVLTGRTDLRTVIFDPDSLLASGISCAFGCMPHGMSMEYVPLLLDRGIRVIDLSADYRLRQSSVYQEWYNEPHRDPLNLPTAVYGLPEYYRGRISTARLVANPGCYPQTAILGLAPLVVAGLVDLETIIVDSKSGVSGAGREPKRATHFPECNESVCAYALGTHRHTPEIEQILGDMAGRPVRVLFTPHLIPMDRGILSTIYATPNRSVTQAEVLDLYQNFYSDQPFVRIRATALPATKDTVGTNFLDIAVRVVRGRVVIVACEDNLIRGASGVAVQNFNLMFGLDERTGLM